MSIIRLSLFLSSVSFCGCPPSASANSTSSSSSSPLSGLKECGCGEDEGAAFEWGFQDGGGGGGHGDPDRPPLPPFSSGAEVDMGGRRVLFHRTYSTGTAVVAGAR